MRRSVEEMAACRVPQEEIARSLGCDINTLRKHFVDELLHGRARKRRELILVLFKVAKKGNIGAIRKALELVDAGAVDQDILDRAMEKPAPEKPEKLGKKEQALKEAKEPDLSTTLGELMAMRQRGTAVN